MDEKLSYEVVDNRSESVHGEACVTVLCTTYNQEAYITQCLDSLVSQQTDFPYMILVHDDNSTDGTVAILRQYANMYPDRIILILEHQNLYQLQIDRDLIVAPYLEGSYLALCEGDDWWTSSEKLQIQHDYLLAHPETALCVHAGLLYSEDMGSFFGIQAPSDMEKDFTTEEVILGDGSLFATNSMMFKKDLYCRPEAYRNWGVGDYPQCIYCSTKGAVHYFPSAMSAYRVQSKGSWSESMANSEFSKKLSSLDKIANGLESMDKALNYEFHSAIDSYCRNRYFMLYSENGEWKKAKSALGEGYEGLSCSFRFRYWLKCHFPNVAKLLIYARNYLGYMKYSRVSTERQ